MIIILTVLTIVIFMIAFGTYVFLQNKKAFLKEVRSYEKTNEKVIEDYSSFVQELGSIGNIVYMPDNSRFELRKNEAVIRLSKLESDIKANIEELEQVVTPTKELEEVRDLLIKALIAFQEYDIKELRGFVETLDPNLASKMMSGYLSQTPFKRAVSVSKESSGYIDKAMEIWYNEKNRLL
ncbi:MAG: hypothetical protein KAS39_06345, partial [Actinomycetia bacterium]|nr:hypothetical protein [Actinomycetes bacterium]